MTGLGFWLRWSWRDLRARWAAVVVVALIIALGTGVYAGLGSTTPWREQSADDSLALLNMYDLRVQFAPGSYVPQDALLAAVQGIDHAAAIAAIESRLIEPTFVNVEAGDESIFARGRLIGLGISDGGPHVNGLHIEQGRPLADADAGQPVAILEYHFAKYYDLPAQGQVALSGGLTLDYVGQGMTPEYLIVMTEEGGYFSEASFAAVFAPLETVQDLAGHEGLINDLVLTLDNQADLPTVRAEIVAALTEAFPQVGVTLVDRDDDDVYQLLYQTIGINQEIYIVIAFLFLAGAMFGAFNLSSRIVEAERRQIGIGMALGLPPYTLAIRPILLGAQIAILGAVFGIVLGLALGKIAQVWMVSVLPMPVTGRLFQFDVFLQAALLGLVLPFVATLYPVWRALRVTPVDAITTGHLIAKGGGFAPAAARLPLPGRSFAHMPVRNLLRSPRRTLLTALGVATAITTLVGMAGTLDGVHLTLRAIENEVYQDHPARQLVFLNSAYPVDAPQVAAIKESESVALAEPVIRAPGRAMHGNTAFEVVIDVLDFTNPLWTPTMIEGQDTPSSDRPGIVLAESAAQDLGVVVGDTITLEHPRREGLLAYQIVQTEVEVSGLHANPWRMFAFMDSSQADMLGLADMTNLLYIDPAAGISQAEIKITLSDYPAVASVISVYEMVNANQRLLAEVVKFLSGVEIAVFALAFLIALNATLISLNERVREIATMFAFGLPVRTATRMAVWENAIIGVIGTLVGLGAGSGYLWWFLTIRMPTILPELRIDMALSATTSGMAVVIGVLVVAVAPVFAVRRMVQMDVPSTLRVME